MNSYEDIKFEVVKELNSRVLNNSFTKLAENDVTIAPEHDYLPRIWECKWINDKAKQGYSKGDCVWINAITSDDDFLNKYGNKVYEYSKGNKDMQYVLSLDWDHTKALPDDDDYKKDQISQYKNILSGYSKTIKETKTTTTTKQLYGKLFDFKNDDPEKLVIYISYADNNKEYLSNSTVWRNVVLSSEDEYKNFLSIQMDLLFENHLIYYHFNGYKTIDEYDKVLMANNLSNFEQQNLYSRLRLKDHTTYANQQGIDFVKKFVKISSDSTYDPDFKLYRWFRLWNSGHLEHGGIVECPKMSKASSDQISDYYVNVDLKWKYYDNVDRKAANEWSYAETYDYDVLSSNFYEKEYSYLYLAKDHTFTPRLSGNINRYNRYNIQITPIEFNISSDLSDDHFVDYNKLKELNYPTCDIQHKNKIYAINEVFDVTNTSFKISKNNTQNLIDNRYYQYYQYYASGYTIVKDLNYDMSKAVVNGVRSSYEYTGSPITFDDKIIVKDGNTGDVLIKDIHYKIEYGNNVDTCYDLKSDDCAYVKISGLIESGYRNSLTIKFKIVEVK